MRETAFRGKRIDNGEWAEGSLITDNHTVYAIMTPEIQPDGKLKFKHHEVDPATVGQYIGLKDKKGKEICEGDILGVRVKRSYQCKTAVKWDKERGGFGIHAIGIIGNYNLQKYEILGNIHDDPELLATNENE